MNEEIKGYCVRCKKWHVMLEPVLGLMKNGRNMRKGRCSFCGAGMIMILKSAEDQQAPENKPCEPPPTV